MRGGTASDIAIPLMQYSPRICQAPLCGGGRDIKKQRFSELRQPIIIHTMIRTLASSFALVVFSLAAVARGDKIEWNACGPSSGTVHSVSVDPCDSQPCTFSVGSEYTIKIDFTPDLDSSHPRSGLAAWNGSADNYYAYSGYVQAKGRGWGRDLLWN
jgi:hypothetical protein